jgi:hypothetical protein
MAIPIKVLALTALFGFVRPTAGSPADLAEEPRVPRAFEGRIYYYSPDHGREISQPVEITVLEQNEYGIFRGTFSWYSPVSGRPEVLCGEGVRLPVEGFYDGGQLSIEVKQSAKHSLCRDFRWRLNRRGLDDVFGAQGTSWRIEVTPVSR